MIQEQIFSLIISNQEYSLEISYKTIRINTTLQAIDLFKSIQITAFQDKVVTHSTKSSLREQQTKALPLNYIITS